MPKEKLPTISIKGKKYVMVKDRILAFHDLYPNGRITCEMESNEDHILATATVVPDLATPERYFTGHAESVRGIGGISGQSPVEVAETSAIGRALGMLGIGILEGVASADEIVKAEQAAQTGIRRTCESCGIEFAVSPREAWKKVCPNCYWTQKKVIQKQPDEEKTITLDEINQAIPG